MKYSHSSGKINIAVPSKGGNMSAFLYGGGSSKYSGNHKKRKGKKKKC